jgi:hypothetical protein
MSRSPIIGPCEKPQPPQRAFLEDGTWLSLGGAQKFGKSPQEPGEELYRLPGSGDWVLIDLLLLDVGVDCAKLVSESEAATFILRNGLDLPTELQAAAERLRFDPAKTRPVQAAAPAHPARHSPFAQDTRHSPDFTSVIWFGISYSFTPGQAAIVRRLWEAWENGTPELNQQAILEDAGLESKRLSDLFKKHPAWKVMIVAGRTRGSFRLAPPGLDGSRKS